MKVLTVVVDDNREDAVRIIEGKVQFDTDEVVKLACLSGRYIGSAFDDAVKASVVGHLRPDVPNSHEVVACTLACEPMTQFKSWSFSLISVSRFL